MAQLDPKRGISTAIASESLQDGAMLLGTDDNSLNFDITVNGNPTRITIHDPRVTDILTRLTNIESAITSLQVEGYKVLLVKDPSV